MSWTLDIDPFDTTHKNSIRDQDWSDQLSTSRPISIYKNGTFNTNTNFDTPRKEFQNQYQYQNLRGSPFNTNTETITKVSKIFNFNTKTSFESIGIAQV